MEAKASVLRASTATSAPAAATASPTTVTGATPTTATGLQTQAVVTIETLHLNAAGVTFEVTCLESGYYQNFVASLGYSTATQAEKSTAKKRFVVLASRSLHLVKGEKRKVTLTLDGAGRRLLAKDHRLRLELVVYGRDASHTATLLTRTVLLTAEPSRTH